MRKIILFFVIVISLLSFSKERYRIRYNNKVYNATKSVGGDYFIVEIDSRFCFTIDSWRKDIKVLNKID